MFEKVLIANRGEIAIRIMESVADAGYRTVGVYSEADEYALHVEMADEAVCIGPAPASESYLVIDKIIDAAKRTSADAIHPGYGFLSENADFARACTDAEIVFIGPSTEAIDLMGNKRAAKEAMIKADVPCIPGYQGTDQSDKNLLKQTKSIGFPLMIKAAAGGGGRGMRLVYEGDDVAAELASARSEALNAFGSDEMILERAVIDGRHIEIQIVADAHGNVIHLGERDCSIQRRHQKVIEEAPSPFVSEELRVAMGKAACDAAAACDYCGAGTVEFLVDKDGNFFFLEMNTRLQVEHPVTELVTGIDLVDWQLLIAAGVELPLAQDEITLFGHAIEARLYAEDPANGFMPQTGHIHHWEEAFGDCVRIDDGVVAGNDVSPYYDPMLAKVIAYGKTREEARRRLVKALEETHLLGVTTNDAFLCQVLRDTRFVAGEATTSFINDEVLEAAKAAAKPIPSNLALGAALLLALADTMNASTWRWSNVGRMASTMKLHVSGETYNLTTDYDDVAFNVTQGDETHAVVIHELDEVSCVCSLGGVRQTAFFAVEGTTLHLEAQGQALIIDDVTYAPALSDDAEGSGTITANTEGLVISVAVAVGDAVERGQTLVTIEAMKMEHRLVADGDGVVKSVGVQSGTQVKKGQLMVEVELAQTSEEVQ